MLKYSDYFLYIISGTEEFLFEENKFIMASILEVIANVTFKHIIILTLKYFAAGYITLFCYILVSVSHIFSC